MQDKQQLICVIMGDHCDRTIDMCIESVLDADKIIFCWGMDDAITQFNISRWKEKLEDKFKVIQNNFDQEDKTMNGKQRNFYLNYLKENCPNDWCLCLDADEIVEEGGINKIKKFIKKNPETYNVHMRHFIGDLGHEDSTVPKHYVPRRLFKIDKSIGYPEVEHPVLQVEGTVENCDATTIWHMAYVQNMWEIKKRYDNHLKKSNMHTPEYLKNWYWSHLFGQYPRKQFNLEDIPRVILDNFGIDKDEIYFANRGVELKHALMVKQWNDYFNPVNVLDLGCGCGAYLYFWNWFIPSSVNQGYEISKWAIDHAFVKNIFQKDISEPWITQKWDLITAIDILEHLNDVQLDTVLVQMAGMGNKFIFSIPFIGDSNLENDLTHIQRRTKEDWIELIESHGIKIKETPSYWLFAHQILVGEK